MRDEVKEGQEVRIALEQQQTTRLLGLCPPWLPSILVAKNKAATVRNVKTRKAGPRTDLHRNPESKAPAHWVWIASVAITACVLILATLVSWRPWRREHSTPPAKTLSRPLIPATVQTSQTHSASVVLDEVNPQQEATRLKREAVAIAEQVAEAYPNDALAYALLGSAFFNTGQSDEAVKHLRKCLELRPNQTDAYEILARVAYEKGDLEDAVGLCQESLKQGAASPDVLNRLGRAQMDLGRTEEAVRTLQQAVRLSKPTSESNYLLAQALMQTGDFAQGKESFLRVVALLPDHTQAYFGLYTACLRLGQTEEAGRYREQFLRLEAIDRKDLTDRSAQEDTLTGLPMVRETVARTLFGAAQIYRIHQQVGKASDLLRRAASLDADSPVFRSALEALYVQRKDPAGGVRVFEQLAAEQPDNGLNHMFLGRLHGQLEHFEAAERSFQKVQELTPMWTEGHRALAELYLRTNRKLDQAQVLAGKVVSLEPSGLHFYLLAVACLKNNDRTVALEAAKKALALSPEEQRYHQLLKQIQQAP